MVFRQRRFRLGCAAAGGDHILGCDRFGQDIACDTVRIDTVAVSIDSLGIYSWRRFVPDTLYDGPVYRLRAKADTVAVADTLAKATETVKVNEVTKPVQVKDAGLQKKLPVPLKTRKLDETSVMMSKELTRK